MTILTSLFPLELFGFWLSRDAHSSSWISCKLNMLAAHGRYLNCNALHEHLFDCFDAEKLHFCHR
jgi:hypothetical protein